MPVSLVYYKTNNGYIDNWLVAGPQIIFLTEEKKHNYFAELRQKMYLKFYQAESGITQMPVERGPLSEGILKLGDYEDTWKYYRCDEDHLVNHSTTIQDLAFLRSWAYTQIHLRKSKPLSFTLDGYGPYSLWVNGKLVEHVDTFADDHSFRKTMDINLIKGANEILIRFEQIGMGHCKHAFSLQVCKPEAPYLPIQEGKIVIPTTIPHLKRRNELEKAFQYGYLIRDIFAAESGLEVFWPDKMERSALTHVRLQSPEGWIYAEATHKGWRGDTAHLGHSANLTEGSYQVVFLPVPREMYKENIRVQRSLKVWVVGNHPFSEEPYGSLSERRGEALLEASRRKNHIFAEIAKMAIGRWNSVELSPIETAIQQVTDDTIDAPINLLALLGMVIRFGKQEEFPVQLLEKIKKTALGYQYQTYMDIPDANDSLESNTLIRLVCELLAGQYYSADNFTEDGNNGDWHAKRVEPLLIEWLVKHGQYGFDQWDSDLVLANTLMGLSYLVDLADSEPIFDLAGALFDKILVGVALNSFKGTLGASRGFANSLEVKGGLNQALAGILRLFWGQGIYNHHLAGYVSVALLKNYELPSIVSDLALTGETIQGKERHGKACKVTYRNGDFLLSSAQDFQAGNPGRREQVWQATLGSEAVVFTNHPGCASQEDAIAPNFWLGNGALPRVAQLQDFLIAIYNIPEDHRMDFTHAYFPCFAFDEYLIRKNWAFARKGDGYLALTASTQLQLMKQGQGAFRELRARGRHTVWICQMGNKTMDDNFSTFKKKVLQLMPQFSDLGIAMQTLRGDYVQFGWHDPLILNHQEVPSSFNNHYDYPAVYAEIPGKQMNVLYKDYLLRLDFSVD